MAEKKTKIKPKTESRYDWEKMKAEYFKSEAVSVSAFLKDNYGIDVSKNGAVMRQVKGWTDEKTELRKLALEKTKQKLVDLYAPTAKELAEMHQGLTTIFKAAIKHELKECIDPKTGEVKRAPNVQEMRRVWEIVKAEKLEPTAVQKNENTLAEDDRNLLSQLLDQNFGDDDDEDEL